MVWFFMNNIIVKPKKYETIYGLINRFNRLVDEENILKDYKLSKMRAKDRRVFKKFTAERRREKQQKRIQSAMNI
jgi:hypothetical protein